MIKTGVFFGSFNPVHWGHIMLAGYLCEYESLDEVWLVVSPQNPLKDPRMLLADDLRLRMTELAVAGFAKLRCCDIEFSMPRPSYTIDTLDELRRRYPDRDFNLIMGADNLEVIEQWKSYERLLADYPLLVYPRRGCKPGEWDAVYLGIRIMQDAPLIEISSTMIRNTIAAGKVAAYFMPEAVSRYIEQNDLYRSL